jgi:predicted nucleic acid-binding Zn ribbon protein
LGDGIVDEKDQKILEEELKKNKKVKWQSFLRDLIVWIVLMIILYLLWTKIIKKINIPCNKGIPSGIPNKI